MNGLLWSAMTQAQILTVVCVAALVRLLLDAAQPCAQRLGSNDAPLALLQRLYHHAPQRGGLRQQPRSGKASGPGTTTLCIANNSLRPQNTFQL